MTTTKPRPINYEDDFDRLTHRVYKYPDGKIKIKYYNKQGEYYSYWEGDGEMAGDREGIGALYTAGGRKIYEGRWENDRFIEGIKYSRDGKVYEKGIFDQTNYLVDGKRFFGDGEKVHFEAKAIDHPHDSTLYEGRMNYPRSGRYFIGIFCPMLSRPRIGILHEEDDTPIYELKEIHKDSLLTESRVLVERKDLGKDNKISIHATTGELVSTK